MDTATTVVDHDNYPIEVAPVDVNAFDAVPRVVHHDFAESLADVQRIHSQFSAGVVTLAALFDGSRRVEVGPFSAPVGVVLIGAAAALLAFNNRSR